MREPAKVGSLVAHDLLQEIPQPARLEGDLERLIQEKVDRRRQLIVQRACSHECATVLVRTQIAEKFQRGLGDMCILKRTWPTETRGRGRCGYGQAKRSKYPLEIMI